MTTWYQRTDGAVVEWVSEPPQYWLKPDHYRLLSRVEYKRKPTQDDFVDLMPGYQLAFMPKD